MAAPLFPITMLFAQPARGSVAALAFALLFLTLPACSKRAQPVVPAPDLIVLQTGRLRGNVYPLDVRHGVPLQHYPFIAGYVRQVRAEAAKTGTPVLLVDLGDSLTGSFAASVTGSANVVSFFNELKYDAIMLGNLDADVTPGMLQPLSAPVLCPFAGSDGQPAMPGTQFAATLEKKPGHPIQLLANFYGDVRVEQFPDRFPNAFGPAREVQPFRAYGALTAAPRAANLLRLFVWMKFEHEGAEPPPYLADLRQLGVDAVLAHRIYGREKVDAWSGGGGNRWHPPVSLNILRNNRGFALARADFRLENGSWRMSRQQILPMSANTAPADGGVEKAMRRFSSPIAAADAKIVPGLKQAIPAEQILQLYLGALASVPSTDVAVYSPDSVRGEWSKGDLYVSDVYNSLPWSTSIVQFEVTAEQLAALQQNRTRQFLISANLPPAGPRTITTSRYFAENMIGQLKTDPPVLRSVAKVPEYQFLVDWLKTQPALEKSALPVGWRLEKAAP